jgi:hypothetical protein
MNRILVSEWMFNFISMEGSILYLKQGVAIANDGVPVVRIDPVRSCEIGYKHFEMKMYFDHGIYKAGGIEKDYEH